MSNNTNPVTAENQAVSPWLDDIEAQSNLSRSQMLMWLGQVVERKAPIYNTVFAWRLKGDIDSERFQRAFHQLVLDCDALRTVVEERDYVPTQRCVEKVPAELEIVDLSAEPDRLDDWLGARARRRLRLDRCMYDSVLVILHSGEAVWYLNQHHIITDATAWVLLFERMIALYDNPAAPGPPPPSFAAYVKQERISRASEASARVRRYWTRRFADAAPLAGLYGQHARSGSAQNERVCVVLGKRKSAALRALAAQRGIHLLSEEVSLFMLFAAAQISWLHRVTGRQRVTIGAPVHNRSSVDAQQTPGLLMEVLPLDVTVAEHETFRSLLAKVARGTMELFGNVVPGVSTPDTSRAFDVLLNFIAVRMPRFPGFDVESNWVHSRAADRAHKLRLQVHDFDGSENYHLDFDFNTAAFDEATRQLAVRHYLTVIDALLKDIDTEIAEVDLLTDDERRQNVERFNATQTDFPAERSIAGLVSDQASLTPDAIAVREGDASWSYADLERRANRIAQQLVGRGAGPGRAVVIGMERSAQAIAAMLGVIKTGAAYVPLDIRHPASRIVAILDDLAGSELGPAVAAVTSDTAQHLLPKGVPLVFPARLTEGNDEPLEVRRAGEDLSYIIYTSGSTGRPKGVVIPQRAMVNYLCWARREYCPEGPLSFALHSSLAVDLTVTSIFVPLLAGGTVVVYPDHGEQDLPIMQVFADDAVDVVKLTPAHLALIREVGGRASRIGTLILGGEDLKRDLVRSVASQFPDDLRVYNEYGPTEGTVGCMIHRFDANRDNTASVPIGRPIANASIYVLDSLSRPVAAGLVGELCIAGPGVALGYLNRPSQTEHAFIPDTVLGSGQMYRSGDLARFTADGRLEYLGRDDDQVKIRGARVELGEVEAALAAHDDVRDVVAIVTRPSETDLKRCEKCGVPSNYPGLVFNDRNVCSMCLAFDLFEDQARAYFKTMDEFDAIAEQMKDATETGPNCLALVSGGKDSSYMLYQLVARGLRPLVFSLDNGFISEEALANVKRAADALDLEHIIGSTPHMNEIFRDSLERYSNVCHGCFKTIYTLSMNLARERGLKYIVTGLSRGQIFETRLDDLYRHRIFDVGTIEKAILEARKVYHRVDDAVARTLDVEIFADDTVLNDIQFVDFYRYCDVDLDEIYDYLDKRAPWVRPSDTGRSTNCLINDVGIYVHRKERGFHNYALPYSWDVRIGHKTREAALYELDDELDVARIQTILDEVGYHPKQSSSEPQLTAYFTSDSAVPASELRTFLAESLPDEMVPTIFVHLEELPLSSTGKVDRQALPAPKEQAEERHKVYDPPETDIEKQLAELWSEALERDDIGRHDNFFDHGGVSLGAIQIMSRVRESFGVELPVHTFFSAPTIAAVAQSIEELLVADIESMSDAEVERLLREDAG